MSPNGYQLALEQATNDEIEINSQIEKLNRRKQSIEKLLELLDSLMPPSRPVGALAAHPAPVAAASELSNSQNHAVPEMHPAANTAAFPASENGRPVSHEQVARLAYRLWIESGRLHGHHEDDWLRAEKELRLAT